MGAGYCAISAKLKAMNSITLNQKDYEQMIQKKSVGEVCGYLKNNTGYFEMLRDIDESTIHRTELELLIEKKIKDEYMRLYKFVDLYDRKILEYLFIRSEIEFIKHQLRFLFNHESGKNDSIEKWITPFFKEHTRLDLDKIDKVTDFASFVEVCKGTIYYDVLKRANDVDVDLFHVVMLLDGFYYSNLWKIISKYSNKRGRESFEMYLGKNIDLLNILWIYRSKKYFQTPNEIVYTYLIPVRYQLTEESISNMVKAESIDKVIQEVSKTKYKALFDNPSNNGFIEENYNRMMYKIAKKVYNLPEVSIATVYAYFKLREVEITNITSIIEGIRYNFNADAINPLLIR